MVFDPRRTYDQLPLLPPVIEMETKADLRQCVRATRALAELKGAGALIPDQSILINAIPLQEAKMSSEIENIVTTQDELYRASVDERVDDPKAKEVLRYRTALRFGFDEMATRSLNLDLIHDICAKLRDADVHFRNEAEQVCIGNRLTGRISYTPPRGGPVVMEKMQNLERYLLNERNEVDPLIRMAIAHYQFEAIHPFDDGNGRTGRIINILYLIHAGLLKIPVLYLSRYIIQHKAGYYQLLREVTESGTWESWLLYMLTGIEETACWTTNRIQAIRDLFDATVDRCRHLLPKIYSKELIETIFRQPYCKIQFLVDADIAKRQTASVYLQELERIGVLVGEKQGREVIYKHPALIEVLTQ